ncbi:MAG: FAD:protein FMN transferase [Bdellovibrio sp.]|nr:FAD:protein FMN transferase [Bdellovibrio sp.]
MKPIMMSEKHMGGIWSIQCYPAHFQTVEYVRTQISKAFAEVHRLETLLTDFCSSPFNEINAQAGIEPVSVCREIYDLIVLALQFSEESHGAFDISYASVGRIWRQARADQMAPSREEINKQLKWVDYRKIIVNSREQTIFLPHKEMRIGLGGIGKGYAVDQAYKLLKENGLSNFAVNGSGDIRCTSAENAPRPWRMGIRNPFSKSHEVMMGILQIQEGAVATSGDYINYVLIDGKKYHHIINPLTGLPGFGSVSSTILSSTALEADVTATIAMVKGHRLGLEYLNRKKMKGMIVSDSGQVFMSDEALKQIEKDTRIISHQRENVSA